ncbi:hypothetical protein AGMMS4952_05680 [Spirochaetia bacterium]|nr:hypothetical protein AGMMS4952_05680 [Spirochaetia bacterium]
MKKEQIEELFLQFESICYIFNEIECWSARELQNVLGYAKWENFTKVIEKAKTACKTSGINSTDHFPELRKMVEIGSGTQREIDDIALTRYACYLIAQNGKKTCYRYKKAW